MSDKEIGDRSSMTPVYGRIKVSCEESVQMVSPIDERKSLLGYFFSKANAMAFGEYTFSSIPSRENFVVSEALDDVLDYHIENGPIRLIPDAYEVKNALQDDLEKSLAKARAAAGQDEGPKLVDTEAHIEVASLEDIIRSMKDNSTSEWNNAFFEYPGEDIGTGPSPHMERKRAESVIFNP
ncbi:unnamed protein product [Fraxinus pennsylvanica]|uniref:Uncharacterized protein n=1 Tax=Fraxinus pennsylvanica TaxID=56036 RepID=A0AAD2E1T7_9LAMI|nr:unnamed protein product [Fraxinus pennsylvanica]